MSRRLTLFFGLSSAVGVALVACGGDDILSSLGAGSMTDASFVDSPADGPNSDGSRVDAGDASALDSGHQCHTLDGGVETDGAADAGFIFGPTLATAGMQEGFSLGAIGDITGDGKNELVIEVTTSPFSANRIDVYVQNECGGLEPPVSYPLPLEGGPMRIADVTGDGRNDVVFSSSTALYVLEQKADHTLAAMRTYDDAGTGNNGPLIGDFDHDGRNDIYIATRSAETLWLQSTTGALVPHLLPDTVSTSYGHVAQVAGDFDHDGFTDVMINGGDGLYLRKQRVDGGLSAATVSARPDAGPSPAFEDIVGADFTGDGRTDIAVTYYYGMDTVALLRQTDDGGLGEPSYYDADTGGSIRQTAVADLDNDGRQDFVALDVNSVTMIFYRQKEDGGFSSASTLPLSPSFVDGFQIGDLNDDGLPDLVLFSAPNVLVAYGAR